MKFLTTCIKEGDEYFAAFLQEIVSVTSYKNNNSTSCENDSMNNFKLCMNVELPEKCQLI